MRRARGGSVYNRQTSARPWNCRRGAVNALLGALACLLLSGSSFAQTSKEPSTPTGAPSATQDRTNGAGDAEEKASFGGDVKKFIKGTIGDQKYIWTSPVRLRPSDTKWLVPLGGIAAGLFVTDGPASFEMSRGDHKDLAGQLSNAGLAALGLAAGSIYLTGSRRGDPQMRETGVFAAEAGANAFVVDEVLRFSLRRSRPNVTVHPGEWEQPGGSSFPSAHAATAFAIATVIADESSSPMTKLLAYGTATAVGLARVKAEQHFPSDVFIGAAAGYLIGHSVYKRHHVPTVDDIGTFEYETNRLGTKQMGSRYIELDSWIYPAIEHLNAVGVVRNNYPSLKPWTRLAVWRMLEGVDESGLPPMDAALVASLRTEFKREEALDSGQLNEAIRVEEVYSRTQYIAGTPLNDSFHFGQTIADDYGRRFGNGLQQINGFETSAEQGRFAFFVRGEYQHSPGIPGYDSTVAQAIAQQDGIPVQTYPALKARDTFRLLDTYVSIRMLGFDLSVGKQSYWWGPGSSGAMMLSNNAEPFYSLRINQVDPIWIPGLSKIFGPFRFDNFFGKLSEHQFPASPYFYGQKVNFQPTPNLEFGFSRDAVIGGEGLAPLTFGNFFHSFFSVSSGTAPGSDPRRSPGARHGSFDLRYRLPKLRNWITLYADGVVHDDISPIDAPQRAAWYPGIYLAKLPFIPKLDLHVEAGTTDTPIDRTKGGQFYYYQSLYKDGYTNKKYLLGSWLGREATGGQAWLTYWLNPQSTIKVGFRDVKTSRFFVPGGGTQQDGYAEVNYSWKSGMHIGVLVQGERWAMPLLASTPQVNVTTQFEISYRPQKWVLTKH